MKAPEIVWAVRKTGKFRIHTTMVHAFRKPLDKKKKALCNRAEFRPDDPWQYAEDSGYRCSVCRRRAARIKERYG